MKKIVLLLSLLFASGSLYSGNFFKLPSITGEEHVIYGESPVEEKEHMLEVIKKRQEALLKNDVEENAALQTKVDKLNNEITELKKVMAKAPEEEKSFMGDKLGLLNEQYQTLVDSQLARNQIISTVKEIVELLEKYIASPSFENIRIKDRAGYQFTDLLEWNQQVVSLEEGLKQLKTEQHSGEELLANFKKKSTDLRSQYKTKEKEQEEFVSKAQQENLDKKLTQQKGQILDLEKELLQNQLDLAELHTQEANYQLELIGSRISVEESKLKFFRKDIDKISKKLIIDDASLREKEEAVAKKKQDEQAAQTGFTKKKATLTKQRDKIKEELDSLIQKHDVKVPDQRLLSDWSFEFNPLADSPWLYRIGKENQRLLVKDQEISLVEAKRDQSKVELDEATLSKDVLNSWYKIMDRQLRSEEFRNKELKFYNDKKVEFTRDTATYRDKIAAVTTEMNNETRALSNLEDKVKNLKENEKPFVSRFNSDTYKKSSENLTTSKTLINKKKSVNAELITIYSAMIGQISEGLKQINLIASRIEKIDNIWQRSDTAISLELFVNNVVPDLRGFYDEVKSIFDRVNIAALMGTFYAVVSTPAIIFKLFILFILLLIAFFLARMYLPVIVRKLERSTEDGGSSTRSFAAVFFSFLYTHLASVFIWCFFFILVRLNTGIEIGFATKVVFYLVSIPFVSYLAWRLVNALARFNTNNNYAIVSKVFQRRLHWVLIAFAIATVTIFSFREAFLLAMYDKYEVPMFLLRCYYIILRILLMCLLIKEEIIGLIPTKSKTWRWIHSQVVQYYYLFLFAILVIFILSDPRIGGYNKLVYYVLSSFLWSLLLFALLWYLQATLKRYSSYIFFKHEEGEAAQERFSNSTTWYGLFVVLSFVFLFIIAIFWGAKIWGYPISIDEVTGFFNQTIFKIKGEDLKTVPIKVSSIITLVGFIIGGVAASNIFERFVLRRIFNLMFVDSAIQNTVSRLSFYCFIIVFLLMGLSYIEISSTMIGGVVLAIFLGLAWSIRTALSDIFGYFTILLERSIKIGDYIKIGTETSEVSGIVRRITPRTTILRKKNSINIILPNSKVIENPVYNWNYTRGFFAFQDLEVVVEYGTDADLVKDIFLKLLYEDHNILKSPHPVVRLEAFTEDGLKFMIRAFLSSINILNQWDIASDIRFKILSELRKHNILIAYPVRIIKMGKPVNGNDSRVTFDKEEPEQEQA
ncbi:MAG TPA: mechanosensitive ion channel [Candidatus Babeliales bacterium]|nr:mechanosensitive ion channel [Candidatus Babeliales bacterium]